MKKLWLIPFLISTLFFASISHAQAEEDGGDIEVIYEPAAIEVDADLATMTLNQLLAKETQENIQKISHLQPDEALTFLEKKDTYLGKISKGLNWISLPKSIGNRILTALNNQFFDSAVGILRANRVGGSVRLQLGAGLAINSTLMAKIRETKLLSFLPKSGGFCLLLGLGFSLSRETRPDGSHHWIFEIFTDYTKLKDTDSFIAKLSADPVLAFLAEHREGKQRVIDINHRNLGPIGPIRGGEQHFSYGPTLGVSLPPFVDEVFLYTLEEKKLVLFSLNLSVLAELTEKTLRFFSGDGFTSVPVCSKIFSL